MCLGANKGKKWLRFVNNYKYLSNHCKYCNSNCL